MIQGTPVGVPSLVQPSGAKIDIEQLRHDIPKYSIMLFQMVISSGGINFWKRLRVA